jgi:hypothetical protein
MFHGTFRPAAIAEAALAAPFRCAAPASQETWLAPSFAGRNRRLSLARFSMLRRRQCWHLNHMNGFKHGRS